MCVMSMVYDHYRDQFPGWPSQGGIGIGSIPAPQSPIDLTAMAKLITEFNAAVSAARQLDVLMKKPDCEDPEKAKLSERVAALEALVKELQGKTA